jgi:OTU-like cysteine protease
MYRALAHQCLLHKQSGLVDECAALTAHQVLRRKAAAHVQEHADAFAPFIVDTDDCATAEEQMQKHLDGILGLEWGTQVELQALAAALQVHIQVRIVQQFTSATCTHL